MELKLFSDRISHPCRACLLMLGSLGNRFEEVKLNLLRGDHFKTKEVAPWMKVPVLQVQRRTEVMDKGEEGGGGGMKQDPAGKFSQNLLIKPENRDPLEFLTTSGTHLLQNSWKNMPYPPMDFQPLCIRDFAAFFKEDETR